MEGTHEGPRGRLLRAKVDSERALLNELLADTRPIRGDRDQGLWPLRWDAVANCDSVVSRAIPVAPLQRSELESIRLYRAAWLPSVGHV
jgi:hypothetical protein